jgi:hypothetical protein
MSFIRSAGIIHSLATFDATQLDGKQWVVKQIPWLLCVWLLTMLPMTLPLLQFHGSHQ